jgi:hypothetical protein
MATVVKTIGSGGGRDYSTLAAWAASLPANLVTDGNSYEGDCYNDSEFTGSSTLLSLSGHTTDASHTITLTTGAGQSFRDNANVQTNALAYNVNNGVGLRLTDSYANVIACFDSYVTISNLQCRATAPNTTAVDLRGGSNTLDNCILDGATSSSAGLRTGGTDTSSKVRNCLIVGGAKVNAAAAHYFVTWVYPSDYNVGVPYFDSSYAAPNFDNCAFFGTSSSALYSGGSPVFTSCMSDVSSPPSGVIGGKTFSNQFVGITTSTEDFREKTGADLQGAGTADSTNGARDIAGTTRPQSGKWDIGCWELLASGTAVTADAWGPIELLAIQRDRPPIWFEFATTQRADNGVPLEAPASQRAGFEVTSEGLTAQRMDLGWLLDVSVTQRSDCGMPAESAAMLHCDIALRVALEERITASISGPVELAAAAVADWFIVTEWLASSFGDRAALGEFGAGVAQNAQPPIEWLGRVTDFVIEDAILPVEWSMLPAPVQVSLDRLLASPGRRRLLATPGRLRLLKRL